MAPSAKDEDRWIDKSLDKNVAALEEAIKKGKNPFHQNPEFWQRAFLKVAKAYIKVRDDFTDDGR